MLAFALDRCAIAAWIHTCSSFVNSKAQSTKSFIVFLYLGSPLADQAAVRAQKSNNEYNGNTYLT